MRRLPNTTNGRDIAICALSRSELAWIISCCGETLEALDAFEFETRVGATQKEIRLLADEAGQIYEHLRSESESESETDHREIGWSNLDEPLG